MIFTLCVRELQVKVYKNNVDTFTTFEDKNNVRQYETRKCTLC